MIYDFEFSGVMPLLMHHDNIEGQDEVKAWLESDQGKKLSKAGDDRTPGWTWMTYLYTDGENITIPCDNIMAALRFGGGKVVLKGNATFKNLTQSGIVLMEEHYPLLVKGGPISLDKVLSLKDRPFSEQAAAAQKLGFKLYTKRAAVGKAKHVRVRPRFDEWSVKGQLQVHDPVITPSALTKILEATGRTAGLCDWRPGAEFPRKPGPYGTFTAKVKPAK